MKIEGYYGDTITIILINNIIYYKIKGLIPDFVSEHTHTN